MKRSVTEGVVVYDDDIDYPAFCRKRNVEAMEGYDEYCTLWREFIDLKAEVRWRNKPNETKQIPRIYTLLLEIERQKTLPSANIAKLDAKKSEYEKFQTYHVALWTQMDTLIKDLGKNEYVKRRNNDDVLKLEDYERALYDMIEK